MAEEAGGWWLFKSLPKAFAAEHGAQIANKVLLKLPGGAEWPVGVRKSCDDIWFQEGWKEFSKFYSLAPHHFLVFEYGSHCHFRVHIFDKTATEIKYPAHKCYVDVELESETDTLNETSDGRFFSPKARGKRSLRSPQPCELKRRRRNEFGRIGRNSEAMFRRGSTSSSMAKQGTRNMTSDHPSQGEEDEDNRAWERNQTFQRSGSLTGAEKASALARAEAAFRPKNPFFMLVMQPAYVSVGMSVNLPHNFFESNLEGMLSDTVILQVPDGRAWKVGYHVTETDGGNRKATFLTKSWVPFAKDNNLEVGDVCTFELVKRGSVPVFNVVIYSDANHRYSSAHRSGNGMKSSSPGRTGYFSSKSYGRYPGAGNSGASKAADAFTSKQPFFKIAVGRSHLSMGQAQIPVAFYDHIKEVYDRVELRGAGGKCWEVRIRRCLRKTGKQEKILGSGWGAFAKGNSLEVGDVCVYELVNPEDDDSKKRVMVLDVHIFKG